MTSVHPLLTLLHDAASGRFPPPDGGVTVVPPYADHLTAVVAFTGHAVIAAPVARDEALQQGADGFGGVFDPPFVTWLSGRSGAPGVIDVTLARRGAGGPPRLAVRIDCEDHQRVRYARVLRRNVRVFGDARGLVTLADGLAGRLELSVEAEPAYQGTGSGRSLIEDALTLVPPDQWVFAAVSPGNARSLRAFLGLGFQPLGSELIILRDRALFPKMR
jgi:GNAT superfamily N-acetyltransferase